MSSTKYLLNIPKGEAGKLACGWFLLSVVSLVLAGLFSLSLVLSRTPYIQDVFPFLQNFHVLLVVHVDLSVLIWFICFAGVFWCVTSTDKIMWLGWTALACSSLGMVLIALCPFVGAANPIMNNYVPVLDDSFFLWGLGIFALGFFLHIMWALLTIRPFDNIFSGEGVLRFGSYMGALTAAFSIVAFVWSYLHVPESFEPLPYYEMLFWGSGHILQFVHTIMMIVAWIWLVGIVGMKLSIGPRFLIALFIIYPVVSLISLATYPLFDATSYEHRYLFTYVMQYGMGVPVIVAAAVIVLELLRSESLKGGYLRPAIISSIFLFMVGGVIGYLVRGVDVTIPAHYHGVIVGVTLAFMGLSFYLLPKLGFREPNIKLAYWQPYIYGIGQFVHILGLTLAGIYGVKRKVAGVTQELDSFEKIFSMGLMGFGGIVAILGGVLFLIIVISSITSSKK